jgi:hypothetical protein
MAFKKGQAANPAGRPKGSKSKLAESFYSDCLSAYNDPRIGGLEGLIRFIAASSHNRMVFYNWLAKTIPSNVEMTGKGGEAIKVIFKAEYADDAPK